MKYDPIKKEYTSIKKSWNSDVSGTYQFAVFDINKDGYPDMYLGGLKREIPLSIQESKIVILSIFQRHIQACQKILI